MDLHFKPVEAEDIDRLTPLFCRRPNKTCDSVFLDSFIWSKLYGVRFAVSDGRAIQWLMENDGITGTAMPICSQEDLEHYFGEIVEYFNTVLKKPLYIHLADEEAVMALGLMEQKDRFLVTEQEDLKDYLYDGDAMRSLSGKKLHKKKIISTDLRGHMRAGMNTAVSAVPTEGMCGNSWTTGESRRVRKWKSTWTTRWKVYTRS